MSCRCLASALLLLCLCLPLRAGAQVGIWLFDEAGGDQALDASEAGNDGTLAGPPGRIGGVRGGALSFSGDGAHVVVPDADSLDAGAGLTVTAWLRPARTATQYVLKKAVYGSVDGYEIGLSSTGTAFVRLNQVSSGNAYKLFSTRPYPADGVTWMHVAATFDGQELRLYVDGARDSAVAAPGLVIAANDTPLSIGAQADGDRGFDGAIDEVRIYDRALGPEEIDALLAGWQPSPPEPRDLYVRRGSGCAGPWPGCGTEGAPFDDIDGCAATVRPGDTCWVMDGVYDRGIDAEDGRPYQPELSGTADRPIAFRAAPGHRPLIRGAPGVSWSFGLGERRDHILYSGFRVDGVMRVRGSGEGSRSRGVVVEDFEICGGGGKDDGNWSGLFAQWVEELTLRNNVIRDVRAPSGHGEKGITVFNGRRTVVEHNYILGNASEGVFDKEGGEDNEYRRNLFENNGVALKINNQSDSTGLENERTRIYENLFLCLESSGLAVQLLSQPTDWSVFQNTSYGCAGIVVRSSSGPASGGLVAHNIWWAPEPGRTVWESQFGDDREPDVMDYNFYPPGAVFRENRFTEASRSFASLAEWRSAVHPRVYDANSREGDPLFAAPEQRDFRLHAASPARSAGASGQDLGAYPAGGSAVIGPEPPVQVDAAGACFDEAGGTPDDPPDPPAPDPGAAPLAHWTLDEGGGPLASDASGRGHHATLVGDPRWIASPRGGALDLDGAGDRLEAGSVLTGGARELSAAAWVQKRDNGDDRVLCQASGTAVVDHVFCLGVAGTTFRVRLRTTGNGGTANYDGGAIPLDQWVHLAFSYDGSSLRLFRDGVERARYAVQGDVVASSEPVVLGNVNPRDDRAWNGALDDLRLYARALDGEDVAGLAGAP